MFFRLFFLFFAFSPFSGHVFYANENARILTGEFFEGYLRCLMETYHQTFMDPVVHYQKEMIAAEIQEEGHAVIYHFPDDSYLKSKVHDFALSFDNVYATEFRKKPSHNLVLAAMRSAPSRVEGQWFAEMRPVFPVALADPKRIGYSVGYRTYDRVLKDPLIPVSMGDQFLFYQKVTDPNPGRLREYCFGVEAGVWAAFIGKTKSLALINADYHVGIPFVYKIGKQQFRFRLYHQSSHLGDEILIEKPSINRLNPSMEALDLFWMMACSPKLSLFIGAGRVLRSDESFKIRPYYIEYGCNFMPKYGNSQVNNLVAGPFFATYVRNWQEDGWDFDVTIAIGYEWKKSHTYGRRARLSLEYHNGFSIDGQFAKESNDYLKLFFSYGF